MSPSTDVIDSIDSSSASMCSCDARSAAIAAVAGSRRLTSLENRRERSLGELKEQCDHASASDRGSISFTVRTASRPRAHGEHALDLGGISGPPEVFRVRPRTAPSISRSEWHDCPRLESPDR